MNNTKKALRLTVSYAELFNRCPPDQLKYAKILQGKHKQYKERLFELPEEPPKIDWDFYKAKVRPEFVSMVEEFEKKYNEIKVPFPEDPYTPQLEELKKVVEKEIDDFKAESNCRIGDLEAQIVFKCCQIPVEEMTWEEFCEYYPEDAPDFLNKPTFWPHTPEEQIPGPANPDVAKRMHKEMEDMERKFEDAASGKRETKAIVRKSEAQKGENKGDNVKSGEGGESKLENKDSSEKTK